MRSEISDAASVYTLENRRKISFPSPIFTVGTRLSALLTETLVVVSQTKEKICTNDVLVSS